MLQDIENPWRQVLQTVKDLQNTIEEDANAFNMSRMTEFRESRTSNHSSRH